MSRRGLCKYLIPTSVNGSLNLNFKIEYNRLIGHATIRLGLAMINMHTKFEVSSLIRSRDILGGLKI